MQYLVPGAKGREGAHVDEQQTTDDGKYLVPGAKGRVPSMDGAYVDEQRTTDDRILRETERHSDMLLEGKAEVLALCMMCVF